MLNCKPGLVISILMVCACSAVYGRPQSEKERNIAGRGSVISQERAVGEFTGITANGIRRINIHLADNHRVVVTTDRDIQGIVATVTENDILNLRLERDVDDEITIDVYLPRIDRINLKTVGSIEIKNGTGLDLEITASTVGSIHLGNYFVENITITGNAVGSIQIWANTLNGDLSAVGTMQYKGNPRMNMDLGAIGGFRQIK